MNFKLLIHHIKFNKLFSLISKNKFLIPFFLILYYLSFPLSQGKFKFLLGETTGLLEPLQALTIFLTIVIHLKYRKALKYKSNNFIIYFKIFILSFIFYEEISFITHRLFKFSYSNNWQYEFNIHNSNIMLNLILKDLTLPFTDYNFNVPLDMFLITLGSIWLGFGYILFRGERFKVLFLQPRYCFYSLLYPINVIICSILIRSNLYDHKIYYSYEIVELFFYLILLIDVLFKVKKFIFNQ